jgi:hypothetical protein
MHVLRIVLTLVIALQGPVAITGGSFRSAAAQRCECHTACPVLGHSLRDARDSLPRRHLRGRRVDRRRPVREGCVSGRA